MSQAALVKISQFKTDISCSKACSSFVYYSCLIFKTKTTAAEASNIRLMEHRLYFRGKKTFQSSSEKDKNQHALFLSLFGNISNIKRRKPQSPAYIFGKCVYSTSPGEQYLFKTSNSKWFLRTITFPCTNMTSCSNHFEKKITD